MSRTLPDREVKKLIGSLLLGGDEQYLNPNGIELRLGANVRFDSTGEEKQLSDGLFLKVNPGETVIVSSFEKLDFSKESVQKIYPGKMIMGIITPTTTMMREGILQVTTKVDAGFRGLLNWGFRNSSTKEFVIQYREPIFKLTLFLLDENEVPEVPYGEGDRHTYQDTAGIRLSSRRIPAQIPKKSIVASSFEKLDPIKHLSEAGYPFNHISTELVGLQGKWEIVSSDIRVLKDQFQRQSDLLSAKIVEETRSISGRLDEFKETFIDKVESLFQKKFFWVTSVLIAALGIMGAVYKYLEAKNVGINKILTAAIIGSASAVSIK
jgi:deoxycytidine triphosphate deaminase